MKNVKAVAEKIAENRVALQIEVEAERVDAALERAYRKVVREVNVPGFRKGRVPRRIIEARFGKEILYEDALEELIPQAYMEALAQEKIEAIDQPEVTDVHIEAGSPLRFRAVVDVMPEAELGEYKGLKVEKEIEKVEESDVDHMLEHLREENAELVAVERTQVQQGDFVLIDYEGYVNGQPFPGGAAKGVTVEVGSGRFVDGFEEQLVGAEVGSEVEVRITLPENHPDDALRGKEALFKVKVHSIKERRLPELDDEFAADVSDAESLEALRAQIRSELEASARSRADEEVREKLVRMVTDASTVQLPKVLVERELDSMVNDFLRNLRYRGIDPERYLASANLTEASLREEFRPNAERRVKTEIVLQTIARREGITVSPEEVEADIERFVAATGDKEAARRRWDTPARRASIEHGLLVEKAVNLLVENAEVEEKEVPSRGHGHHHHHHHDEDEDSSEPDHDHEHDHGDDEEHDDEHGG